MTYIRFNILQWPPDTLRPLPLRPCVEARDSRSPLLQSPAKFQPMKMSTILQQPDLWQEDEHYKEYGEVEEMDGVEEANDANPEEAKGDSGVKVADGDEEVDINSRQDSRKAPKDSMTNKGSVFLNLAVFHLLKRESIFMDTPQLQ